MNSLPLAVSMGEPAGIGPDLILQIYAARAELGLAPFVVFGSAGFLRARAERLELSISIGEDSDADGFAAALPVHDFGPIEDTPGQVQKASAPMVIAAIEAGVRAVQAGACRALVTAPIHKATLYSAGFKHPGHTEFLAELCASDGSTPLPVMMLAHEGFRVVPLSVHVPISEVPALVTQPLILETARIVARELTARFGIAAPRLAVAGLNPHAGEDGTIGREEMDVIAPAVSALQAEGLDVVGPLSADTLFYPAHWQNYDCVIAMYHDQALIPIKTIAFDEGVNVTLGLPIVRTSPDHGTAFELAGSGKASPKSFLAALRMAAFMSEGMT